jgi:RNase H-fold protein (predicted Holliday junction resolvase)
MAAEATRFATRLSQHIGLPVEMTEERLTSWEAGQNAPTKIRAHGSQRKPGMRATRDDVAAAIILRDYLAARPPARKRAHAARAKN